MKRLKHKNDDRKLWQAISCISPSFKEEFVRDIEARVKCGMMTEEEGEKAIREMYESYDRAYKK